mmetsp:Transcript_9515/g.15572  ORF Transcript_9515/g.15572 Transcript_9515/m.15572 type:complete len:127 (+) Transcript_9515:35-415(+)
MSSSSSAAAKPVTKKTVKKTASKKKSSPRLFVNATHVSFKRSRHRTYHHTSLIKLEGVTSKHQADFYVGKRIAYIYRVPSKETRAIWGTITRPHGNAGTVRAKFASNLPAASLGHALRVMLYPSKI